MKLESAIYRGRVRHRRFRPGMHAFSYPLFMLCIKTDEIPAICRKFWQIGPQWFRWARLRRQDYIGDIGTDIASSVRGKLTELTRLPASSLQGDVFMLVHLRYLGIYFSPLNLYFLRQNGNFRYMLAEVSNTPWNERHYYAVDLEQSTAHAKEFHVSPFNPMAQSYTWRVLPPLESRKGSLVHIDVCDEQGKIFDATLGLKRIPLNQVELSRVLLRRPSQTLSLLRAIYWQALKIFLKRTPLYSHPGKPELKTTTGRS